jgi:hypothetical protein
VASTSATAHRKIAPKLPVAVATTSDAKCQRIGSMAADAIESVTGGKLPNALAIVTDRRSPQNRNRTVKRLLRVRAVSCLLDTSVEERARSVGDWPPVTGPRPRRAPGLARRAQRVEVAKSLSSPSLLLAANRPIFDARLGGHRPVLIRPPGDGTAPSYDHPRGSGWLDKCSQPPDEEGDAKSVPDDCEWEAPPNFWGLGEAGRQDSARRRRIA